MDSRAPVGAIPTLRIHCETWAEFAARYASDLATAGLYIETESPLAVLSVLEVRLQLPEANEIVLRARVVQVLDAAQAKTVGKTAGMGLELLDLDAERNRQVTQLIEFARWQGASGDPHASFTHTLMELSPSLPPAEVGYRLSLLPTARPPDAAPRSLTPARASKPATEAARQSCSNQQRADPTTEPRHGSSQSSLKVGAKKTRSAAPPEKPTDQIKLKQLLTNFAHKHFEAALQNTREMLADNPGDPVALRWQLMCNARLALGRDDPAEAAKYYELALQYDGDNREAREFVREFRREQRLNSLPFGRYFTRKK